MCQMKEIEPFFVSFLYLTVLVMFRDRNIFLMCHAVCQICVNKSGRKKKKARKNDTPKIKKPCKSMTYRVLKVPGTGIEPALPCENQILSLTRLPVPPSGLVVVIEIKLPFG